MSDNNAPWLELVQLTLGPRSDHSALTKPKQDVSITRKLDFGQRDPGANETSTREIVLENSSQQTVSLFSLFSVPSKPEFVLEDDCGLSCNTCTPPVTLFPGEQLIVRVHWHPTDDLGVRTQFVVFGCESEGHFEESTGTIATRRWVLGSQVIGSVGDASTEVLSKLSVEARPFVPAWMRTMWYSPHSTVLRVKVWPRLPLYDTWPRNEAYPLVASQYPDSSQVPQSSVFERLSQSYLEYVAFAAASGLESRGLAKGAAAGWVRQIQSAHDRGVITASEKEVQLRLVQNHRLAPCYTDYADLGVPPNECSYQRVGAKEVAVKSGSPAENAANRVLWGEDSRLLSAIGRTGPVTVPDLRRSAHSHSDGIRTVELQLQLWLQALLIMMEEHTMSSDLRSLDIHSTVLSPPKSHRDAPGAYDVAALHVPGLPEGRPPLRYGDIIRIRWLESPIETEWQGVVLSKQTPTTILVKFHPSVFHQGSSGNDSDGAINHGSGTPSAFDCPITHEILVDPVVCEDGQTYERSAIEHWLRYNHKSPMTNAPMGATLIPNHQLRSQIREYQAIHPLAASSAKPRFAVNRQPMETMHWAINTLLKDFNKAAPRLFPDEGDLPQHEHSWGLWRNALGAYAEVTLKEAFLLNDDFQNCATVEWHADSPEKGNVSDLLVKLFRKRKVSVNQTLSKCGTSAWHYCGHGSIAKPIAERAQSHPECQRPALVAELLEGVWCDQRDYSWLQPGLNEHQKRAVDLIVRRKSGEVPFVMFGPPGTGKTMVAAEAIFQAILYYEEGGIGAWSPRGGRDQVKVLACAPSNSAADVLAIRVARLLEAYCEGNPESTIAKQHQEQTFMLRLNSYQRSPEEVPQALYRFCSMDNNHGMYDVPPEMNRFRVIVTTCATSHVLSQQARYGIDPPFTPDFIFVDEASQAMEAEALVPLAVAPDASFILLGDPKQIGATIRSDCARALGLGMSLQERLMQRDVYTEGSNCFCQLVYNYRAHPRLLELPSKLFYQDVLQPFAPHEEVMACSRWSELPNPECPLLFFGLVGEDKHDLDSPSFYNPMEAAQISELIKSLLTSPDVKVTTDDIGYRKQVTAIRMLLRSQGLSGVRVGSVQDYQGQEEKVIFISTVVSRRHWLHDSNTSHLLSSPSRFNVAITRAKALLCIVGNPHVLREDPSWFEMLKYCAAHNCYTGAPTPGIELPDVPESKEAVVDQLAELALLGAVDDSNAELEASSSCELEWRVML